MAFGRKKEEQKEPKVVVAAPTTDLQKFAQLFSLSKEIDKKYETTNSIIRLGAKNIVALPSIPANLPTFDQYVLGCGGIPRGRIVEIFGPESAGKTTFTLWLIGQEQKAGGICAFIDAAHALDTAYARNLGVNIDNLLISQPDHGDQALDIVRELVKSQCVSLIVVDDVASLTPEAELLGEMGDNHVGIQARMMSQAMRILTADAARNQVTIILINQIREKIGVMFGNPETTPGGRALKHYASVRLDVRRQEVIKESERVIGHHVRLKAVKNKVGTPLRETVVDLYYPDSGRTPGFDYIGDLITHASNQGLFEMSGSWYSLDGERIANGLVKLKEALRNNTKVLDSLRTKILTSKKPEPITV